ncbi:MAG: NAD-dependent epimerase/dehydratase family protein [Planctomycetota bacterium]
MDFFRTVKGKKILIAGVSGRVGLGLGFYLSRHGNEVHGLGKFDNAPTRSFLKSLNIVTHVRNLASPDALERVPEDFDYVFNMAVYWGHADRVTHKMWRTAVQINARFPADLVAKFSHVGAVVLGSTGGVYQPSRNDGDLKVENRAVPEGGVGDNIYENSKLIMEDMVRWSCEQSGTRGSILRYFWPDTPYYPRVDMATMPLFSSMDGTPISPKPGVRHVSYISELVRWTINALGVSTCPPRIINCGHPDVVDFARACRMASRVTGKKPNVNRNGYLFSDFRYLGNFGRQEALLGAPKLHLTEIYNRLKRGYEEKCRFPEEWMFEEIW